MGIIFGSARIDEYGNITGGAAGDQTGNEVSTQSYYMHKQGWYDLRPKSADVANKIAAAMKQACDNNNIGYDQNQRNTVMTQLKKYGSLAAIKTKCEADCSSLVRACIYQATGKDVGDIYTGNLASTLEGSGLFESRFSVSSESQLYDGDVLVTKTKGHTVVVVSGRARSGESSGGGTSESFKATGTATCTENNVNVRSGPGTNYSSYGKLGKDNRFEVDGKKSGNWVHIRVKLNGSDIVAWISGDYVKYDQPQNSNESEESGSSSSSSSLNRTPRWVGQVTTDTLNVRSWAGTENPNIKSWPTLGKGNLVDVCDTVKASDGSDWYYIRIDGRIYGFVSAKYIKNTQDSSSSGSSSNTSSTRLNRTPKWVGKCTADSLHVRTWAGTENPDIKSWPRLGLGNLVDVCDTVKASDGSDWYYIRIDGRIYGFVSAEYIVRA